ncbi:hypothetical protein OG462_44405 [Streptomyces sp. NBC_01077]|nr:hypothetical protein OG462_00600 [Streptomyces sp. NBC_01077]WSV43744.1 hypothetical protein OG462_44405 [Streptomyces sp. NBC_01077]
MGEHDQDIVAGPVRPPLSAAQARESRRVFARRVISTRCMVQEQ